MNAEFLRVERSDGVTRVVLYRPPLNVLHLPMLRELERVLAELVGDREMRVLMLAGAGRVFCAGVDVADHLPERVGETLERFHAVIRRLREAECPVVAAVHGAALGGGCELAAASDLVLARAETKLGQPEVALGAIPPAAAALLPRLLGPQRALDLILTGRTVTAEEAHGMGLVAQVLPEGSFEEEALAYARGLASLSRPVLALAKRAVREGLDRPVDEALQGAEDLYLKELVRLADAREGLDAFLEKREPAWRNA